MSTNTLKNLCAPASVRSISGTKSTKSPTEAGSLVLCCLSLGPCGTLSHEGGRGASTVLRISSFQIRLETRPWETETLREPSKTQLLTRILTAAHL